ncbi:MAG: biotin synthase BioB [Gammaproteobacteria bacterium]|nr:biotin synthase BioB [Gammaproteobacteria bacterium]
MSVSSAETVTTPSTSTAVTAGLRHDWCLEEIQALFDRPLNDLLFAAQTAIREYFNPNHVQLSTLVNIKSGGCPEDCAYCPQSIRYQTGLEVSGLMDLDAVRSSAQAAKDAGASRFCMGAAWRSPRDRDIDQLAGMIEAVKSLGLETCMTLGMLTAEQAGRLSIAGLDYYNHNLDSSEGFYGQIITTRTYQDRIDTLQHVRDAGIHVCSGGIIGMGEDVRDRAGMLMTLANLPQHPESVPINLLVKVEGTPLENVDDIDPLELVRTIAVARIMMPASYVRLSAGRDDMSDEHQALCFAAGANSVFYGEKLLTTGNPEIEHDRDLFARLGLTTSR